MFALTRDEKYHGIEVTAPWTQCGIRAPCHRNLCWFKHASMNDKSVRPSRKCKHTFFKILIPSSWYYDKQRHWKNSFFWLKMRLKLYTNGFNCFDTEHKNMLKLKW